jgi:hypothetical protein
MTPRPSRGLAQCRSEPSAEGGLNEECAATPRKPAGGLPPIGGPIHSGRDCKASQSPPLARPAGPLEQQRLVPITMPSVGGGDMLMRGVDRPASRHAGLHSLLPRPL